jgi:hypothetical protein
LDHPGVGKEQRLIAPRDQGCRSNRGVPMRYKEIDKTLANLSSGPLLFHNHSSEWGKAGPKNEFRSFFGPGIPLIEKMGFVRPQIINEEGTTRNKQKLLSD